MSQLSVVRGLLRAAINLCEAAAKQDCPVNALAILDRLKPAETAVAVLLDKAVRDEPLPPRPDPIKQTAELAVCTAREALDGLRHREAHDEQRFRRIERRFQAIERHLRDLSQVESER